MIRTKKLYDDIVCFLLYWCVLQEIILSVIYKTTSSQLLTNVLFYSKDFFMMSLFLNAVTRRNNKKIYMPTILYIALLVIVFLLSTVISSSNLMSLFQNMRNFLVFPCFVMIGANINDKARFYDRLIRFYFPFIVICALLGIIEYSLDFVIGTKNFWTSTLGYTNFYVDIKHQSNNMLYGLPGNFYGSYGKGYFSTKRLVGPWANPLTSAYSMALPMIYYFIKFANIIGKTRVTGKNLNDLMRFLIMLVAVYFTHTRLILLALILVCAYYFLAYSRKKIILFILTITGMAAFFIAVDWGKITSFMYDGSTVAHILSVTSSISNMKYTLFGNGLSYIGIYGSHGATESAYLTILGNLGMVGLGLFVYIYISCCRLNLKAYKRGNNFALVVFLASIVFAISGAVSEQLFAYTTIATFYTLLGMNSGGNYLNENRN